jgi:hypothetical protein
LRSAGAKAERSLHWIVISVRCFATRQPRLGSRWRSASSQHLGRSACRVIFSAATCLPMCCCSSAASTIGTRSHSAAIARTRNRRGCCPRPNGPNCATKSRWRRGCARLRPRSLSPTPPDAGYFYNALNNPACTNCCARSPANSAIRNRPFLEEALGYCVSAGVGPTF